MSTKPSLLIEHHAMMFAFLSKRTFELAPDVAEKVLFEGMTKYGKERGARMAANAVAHGDPLNTMTNQAYGEWTTDFPGQMDFGQLRTQPTLQTYIAKCAWCDAWKKHKITEFGKYYCVNVDNAVYQGFRSDLVCKPTTTSLSWGGQRCEFDWAYPLSDEETKQLAEKKKELGTSCMKDFTFHTAHLKYTVGNTIKEMLGEKGDEVCRLAFEDFINTFGQEAFDCLAEVDVNEF